jgi:short-subunit dehydrogenase
MADEQAEVWIPGATGRIGRALVPRIAARTALVPVLVGRDPGWLAEVSAALDRPGRTAVAASTPAMAG